MVSGVGGGRRDDIIIPSMPTFIAHPTEVEAAGQPPKRIQEFIGRVTSKHEAVSVAKMTSPVGWTEPAQTPEFDEFTIVLEGMVRVTHEGGVIDVRAGQAVWTRAGEMIQYSTPGEGGAEYIAVCLPAFSPDTVHRED